MGKLPGGVTEGPNKNQLRVGSTSVLPAAKPQCEAKKPSVGHRSAKVNPQKNLLTWGWVKTLVPSEPQNSW